MRFTNRAGLAVVALTAGIAVAACGGSYNNDNGNGGGGGGGSTAGSGGGSGGGADNSPLKVNIAVAPGTLDPAEGCGSNDLAIIGSLYTRLTQYGSKPGPDGTTQFDPSKIEPYAAKSWDITDGGKTYTFHLRPGMKFPSGKPVTSSDVKYSFNRSLTVNGCGGYFIYDGLLTPPLIKSMETPDPLTLVIKIAQPDPNALQAWGQPAAGIVDPSVVDAHGGVKKNTVNQYMASHAAGAGPFLVSSYEPNKEIVLKANPDFAAGPPPASKEIDVNFVNSDPTLLLDAKSGQADITLGLSKQSAKSLQGNSNVRLIVNETPLSEQIGLLNSKPPFNNLKVRQAVTLALPYKQIVEKAAFGYGKLFSGPLEPIVPYYSPSVGVPPVTNEAKAKQLIKASGIKTPVTVQMAVQEGNSADQQIATIAQGEWAKLGINVKILTLPASAYTDGTENHKYESYVRLDGPGVVDPGYFLGYDMLCGIGFNLSAMCIPQADKLLTEARRTTDKAKLTQLYEEISKLWLADSPKIQVYADDNVTVLSKDVKSYYYAMEADLRRWGK